MTLAELQAEIWKMIGEPSDLYDDLTAVYDAALTSAINEGLRVISTWKDPVTGRPIRYPLLKDRMFFQSYYTSGTLDAAGSTTTVVLPSGSSTEDDAYNGWLVAVSGVDRRIVDYVGSTLTATVAEAFATSAVPESGDSYTLSKEFMRFLPATSAIVDFHIVRPTGFIVPIFIRDLDEDEDIIRAARSDTFTSNLTSPGTPAEYLFLEDRIVFDYTPDEARWYEMEYTRLPAELSSDTDEPEIPEMYHYGIVLWCRWWGYAREQSLQEAYAAKRDLVDFMRERVGSYHFENDREVTHGVLRRK
jgi:hypothetical protein